VVIPQKWDQESFDLVSDSAVSQNWSPDLDVTKDVLYLSSDIGTAVLAVDSRMSSLQVYEPIHGTFRPMINRVALAGDDRLDLLLVQESENLLTPVCFIGVYPPNLRRELLGKFKPEPAKSMSIVLPRFCSDSHYNCSGGEGDCKIDFPEKLGSLRKLPSIPFNKPPDAP